MFAKTSIEKVIAPPIYTAHLIDEKLIAGKAFLIACNRLVLLMRLAAYSVKYS
jgi:hypothetical protein